MSSKKIRVELYDDEWEKLRKDFDPPPPETLWVNPLLYREEIAPVWKRAAKMRAALFALLAATGCYDDFTVSVDGAISFEASIYFGVDSSNDGGVGDEEAAFEAASNDAPTTPDAPLCTSGVEACNETWALYCSRMKSCCAGQCPETWQNNGGSECFIHYFNNPNWCAGNRANDTRCDNKCMMDIQAASCTVIKQQGGVWQVSPACNVYWN